MSDTTQKPAIGGQVQGNQTVPATPATPVAPIVPVRPVVEEPGIEESIPTQTSSAEELEGESFEDIDNTDSAQV